MAEGIIRYLYGDRVEVYSAGVLSSFVHPLAIEIMYDIDIDISFHQSKSVEDLPLQGFDFIVTLSDFSRDHVSLNLLSGFRLHWPFDDPAFYDKEKFSEVRDLLFSAFKDKFSEYLR